MRLRQRPTDAGSWAVDRDEEIARDRRTGLGIRPRAWWIYESARPDLADGAGGGDVYNHLRPESVEFERSKDRLRHLHETGELTDDERRSIEAGEGPRYEWRQEVIRGDD